MQKIVDVGFCLMFELRFLGRGEFDPPYPQINEDRDFGGEAVAQW